MGSISLIVLAIFGVFATTTAKSVYEPRIVNGENAQEGQFPYTASLRNAAVGHFCGASILSSRFLLTAAHCCMADNASPKNVVAVVGALRRSSGGVTMKVDTITPHHGFVYYGFKNDIALIRTATEINFNDNIKPIALPTENLSEGKSIRAVLSGWGRHKFPSLSKPDVLQFYEIETISNNECANRFPKNQPFGGWVRRDNVCTDNKKNSGACHGDSGSGLVDLTDPNQKTVVGITSWSFPCAQGYPDVFTRVYSHLNWIQEQIVEQSSDLWL